MIEIKNLCKDFGDEKIEFFDTLFEENKSYVILGPSGCGKSTLLNLLSGNIKANSGKITVRLNENNYSIENMTKEKLREYRKNNISYISQDFKLFDEFSIYDNLKIINKIKNVKFSVEDVANLVGLRGKLKQKVKTLSGGEKQRVAIARALLQQGKIILCDEPTGSLNQGLAKDIIKIIIDLQKRTKSTLIVVTHDEGLAKYFDETINYNKLIKIDREVRENV